MTTSGKRRRPPAAALAAVLFFAAAFTTLSVLVLHGATPAYHNEAQHEYVPLLPLQPPTDHQSVARNETRATDQNKISARPEEHKTFDSCSLLNSEAWLEGPRLGNTPFESQEAASNIILVRQLDLSFLLKQTICHKQSRFVNWTDDSTDEVSLNLAAMRLIYLAFHIHQHEPAKREALARRDHDQCAGMLQERHSVGNFDYECPDAKFLVVPLQEAGLGAVMRLTAVNALLAGMATGRVVMFVNNAPVGPDNVQKPWSHASCDRRDIQCFFLPLTPCVLTTAELSQAHVLSRSEMRIMFRTGEVAGPHAQDRVVVTKINTRPHMAPPHLRENLVAIVRRHIMGHDRIAVEERAVELIMDIEPLENSKYYYFGHSSKPHHAAVFYTMRPRPSYAKLLDNMVDNLPDGFQPDLSLGLPIRGTDYRSM